MTDEHTDRLPHLPGEILEAGRVVRRAGYTIVKREAYAELREDLDEIKRLAYMGGQDAETVRRTILGVFEKRSRS